MAKAANGNGNGKSKPGENGKFNGKGARHKGSSHDRCTIELTRKAAALVLGGNTLKTVGEGLGICPDTLFRWIRAGKEGKAPCYVRFHQEISKARALWEAGCLKKIMDAGAGPKADWRALAWALERRNPDWAPPEQKQRLSGGTDPLRIQSETELTIKREEEVSAEDLLRFARRAQLEAKRVADGEDSDSD